MMRTIALLLSLLGHTHAHAAPSLHRPFVAKPATTALSTNRGPQLRLPPLSTTLAYTGLATTLAGASIATNAALGASAAAIVAGSMAVPAVTLLGEVYFMGGGARIAKMMGGVPADARLHAMAIDAANRVGVPAPATVWELPNDAPNAFAVGLRKADTAVAVTAASCEPDDHGAAGRARARDGAPARRRLVKVDPHRDRGRRHGRHVQRGPRAPPRRPLVVVVVEEEGQGQGRGQRRRASASR